MQEMGEDWEECNKYGVKVDSLLSCHCVLWPLLWVILPCSSRCLGMKNMILSMALETTMIFSISTVNVSTKCSKFLNDAFSTAEPWLAWTSDMFSSFLLLARTVRTRGGQQQWSQSGKWHWNIFCNDLKYFCSFSLNFSAGVWWPGEAGLGLVSSNHWVLVKVAPTIFFRTSAVNDKSVKLSNHREGLY